MGSPPRPSRRWRVSRPLVITGLAAVVVGAGAGVAAAVTSSPNQAAAPASSSDFAAPAAASPTPSAPPLKRMPFFRPGKIIGFGGLGLGAIHGQFVVPKSGGGFQTVDTQRGQVTAVSTTSITLKSADGFTKTYPVTSSTIVDARRDGIGSVKVGDQAAVVATVSGSTATAVSITDITNLQNLRQQFFGSQQPPASSG